MDGAHIEPSDSVVHQGNHVVSVVLGASRMVVAHLYYIMFDRGPKTWVKRYSYPPFDKD